MKLRRGDAFATGRLDRRPVLFTARLSRSPRHPTGEPNIRRQPPGLCPGYPGQNSKGRASLSMPEIPVPVAAWVMVFVATARHGWNAATLPRNAPDATCIRQLLQFRERTTAVCRGLA